MYPVSHSKALATLIVSLPQPGTVSVPKDRPKLHSSLCSPGLEHERHLLGRRREVVSYMPAGGQHSMQRPGPREPFPAQGGVQSPALLNPGEKSSPRHSGIQPHSLCAHSLFCFVFK